jgi:endonuclease/exonuclease/phosphatase (EEP) superfamily protein YafD
MNRPPSPLRTLAGVIALALGATSLAGALLAQGGRVVQRLDLFGQFAPLWLLAAGLAVVPGALAAAPRWRPPTLIVGGAGVLAAAVLMAPELSRPRPPETSADGPARLRLIQYNAWLGNRTPLAAADWLAAQKPDVISVQELSPALRDGLIQRGFAYRRGMTRTMAIFSRAPPGRAPFPVPMADWPVLPEFTRATFAAPGAPGTYDLVSVHMPWPSSREYGPRATQLAGFLDLYPSDRLILAGDFNLTPWSLGLARLDHRLGAQRGGPQRPGPRRPGLRRLDRALPTFPARIAVGGRLLASAPFMPIDHVWAGPAWRVLGIHLGPAMGSDHRPIIVDLALGPTTAPGGALAADAGGAIAKPAPGLFTGVSGRDPETDRTRETRHHVRGW